MLRKNYTQLIIIFLFTAVCAVAADNQPTPIRFAILGDRTGSAIEGVYESVVAEIELMKPDFVITVGDMIEGPVSDSAECVRRWDEYFEISKQLSMPIYYTAGNNDIDTKIMATMYQHYLGKPYYSFDVGEVHITVIDNSLWDYTKDYPQEQIDWLKEDLQKAQSARYRFVFAHKPFWYNTIAFGKEDFLHDIFVEYKVSHFFCGHFHRYFTAEYDGVKYTTFGSSGGGYADNPWSLGFHFGWVTIDENGVHIAPIQRGAVKKWDILNVDDIIRSEKNQRRSIVFENHAPVDENFQVNAHNFKIKLTNFNDQINLVDTLSWEIPDSWQVTPALVAIDLPPDSTIELSFDLKTDSALYPVPKLNLTFPFNEKFTQDITRSLSISRKAVCYKTENPMVIDGLIDDGYKLSTKDLFQFDGQLSTDDSVLYYIAYDDKYLYLATYCHESQIDSLVAKVVEHDGAVYTDDCVGFFFQPDPKLDTLYQIYINPLGTVFDQMISSKEDGYYNADQYWNGEYELKCSQGADYWISEAKIPLASIGATPKSGDKWRINLRRKHQRVHSSYEWQIPFSYDPANFGYMVIE